MFEGKVRKNQKFNVKKTLPEESPTNEPEAPGEGKVLSLKKGKQEMESAEAVNEIGLQIETLTEINKGDTFEFRVQ